MAETIMPCFVNQDGTPREEGVIIGRILAGYGELELEMCNCISKATGHLDGAIKAIFGERGELKRICRADSLMKAAYVKAGFEKPYRTAMDDIDWCRRLRNQYSHCHWYYTVAEGICFLNLEDAAKITGPILSVTGNRVPINAVLLGAQETYLKYVQKCFWYLAEQYENLTVKRPSQLFALPAKLARPAMHNGP